MDIIGKIRTEIKSFFLIFFRNLSKTPTPVHSWWNLFREKLGSGYLMTATSKESGICVTSTM